MVTCLKCGNFIPDGQKFCSHCGSPVPIVCPYCGQPRDRSMPHCPNCGDGRAFNGFTPAVDLTPASDLTPPMSPAPPSSLRLPKTDRKSKTVTPPEFVPTPEKEQKRRFPKVLLFGGIGAAVVAAAILCVVLFAGRASTSADYALYLKDREIYYSGLSGTPNQMTDRLISSGSADNEDLSNGCYSITYQCRLSSDGKLLFFPDRLDSNSGAITLYYRSVNNSKKEPVKIAADVEDYAVNDDATLVTYRRYSDDALYQYNIKTGEKEKIANNVGRYDVSADGNRIVYRDDEQNLYLKVSGKDKEKIDSDTSSYKYITPDFKTVYYYKEDSFYCKTEGESRIKLASDVSTVLAVYETGEFYYLRDDSIERPLSAYVEDDMYDIDLNITYPTSPDYPRWWQYNTDAEYQRALDAYEAASAQYDIDYQLYLDKTARDDIRWDLENDTYTESHYTLFYYDGANSVEISDKVVDYYSYFPSPTTPAIAFTTVNAEIGKIKISEISGTSDVSSYIYEQRQSDDKAQLAIHSTTTDLNANGFYGTLFSRDGKTLYFRDKDSNLYSVKISSGAAPELYDTDVEYYSLCTAGDNLLYFKDEKHPGSGVADLYCNGKLVDYDVYLPTLEYTDDGKTIAYCADWSENSQSGVLKVSRNGGAPETVTDDCHAVTMLPSGSVLYLYDYSTRYYKGDLYIYRNGKTEKLDEEVIAILPLEDVKD